MTAERTREAPAERFDSMYLAFDLHTEADAIRKEPSAANRGHRQKTLFKHGGRTIALFVMDPGGVLPEHAAAGTVSIQSIEGEIAVTVGDREERLGAGRLLVMQPGARHAVRAISRSAFLLQVSLGT